MHWKRLRQSVCQTSECRMSYSPQCPSLLNGWHSQTAEKLFGVLGSPSVADGQARLPATTGRASVPESGRIFSGCTLLTCSFRFDMPQCTRSKTGNKDVFGRLRAFSPISRKCFIPPLVFFLLRAFYPLPIRRICIQSLWSYSLNSMRPSGSITTLFGRSAATLANVRNFLGSKYRSCGTQNCRAMPQFKSKLNAALLFSYQSCIHSLRFSFGKSLAAIRNMARGISFRYFSIKRQSRTGSYLPASCNIQPTDFCTRT